MASDQIHGRERTMPLVPEPMENSRSRQAYLRGTTPMTQSFAPFCPDLNDMNWLNSMSQEQINEFGEKVVTLQKHAQQNASFHASEYTWEADAWHDVFGILRDDERLRIDKRPYEFAQTDELGNRSILKRTPDATMGLRSYDEIDLKKGYTCSKENCKEDHSVMQPLESLSQERIRTQMYEKDCGLVVDGRWGEAELLFPFAVYEAKKKILSYEEAEEQVYDACDVYLGMLDDLARDPHDVTKYQSSESEGYQMFAFVSCGPVWQVFVAWNLSDSCLVETIWEGDIRRTAPASQLTYIMIQVRDYAVNQHRKFVSSHLEPWLLLGAKLKETSVADMFEDVELSADDTDEDIEDQGSQSSENCDEWGKVITKKRRLSDFNVEDREQDRNCDVVESWNFLPEWLLLKKRTQQFRSTKAAETRKRKAKNEQRDSMTLQHSKAMPAGFPRWQQPGRSNSESNSTEVLQSPRKRPKAATSGKGRAADSERWRKAFQKFAAEYE